MPLAPAGMSMSCYHMSVPLTKLQGPPCLGVISLNKFELIARTKSMLFR